MKRLLIRMMTIALTIFMSVCSASALRTGSALASDLAATFLEDGDNLAHIPYAATNTESALSR